MVLFRFKKIKPTLNIYNYSLTNISEAECNFEMKNTDKYLGMIEMPVLSLA